MSQAPATDRRVQQMLEFKRTPMGLPTHAKGSPLLFRDIVARLRRLAAARETPRARAEVDAALGCQWWGLRVVAMQVIGAWGGSANKAWLIERALRDPPDRSAGRKEFDWWSVETSAAMRAVAALLDDSDASWALTLDLTDYRAGIELFRFLEQIPDEAFLAWLPEPLRLSRGRVRLRLTNIVGRRQTLPGYRTLMENFASDADESVASAARRWLAKSNNNTGTR